MEPCATLDSRDSISPDIGYRGEGVRHMVEREVPPPFTKEQIRINCSRKETLVRKRCQFRIDVLRPCLQGQASKRHRVDCSTWFQQSELVSAEAYIYEGVNVLMRVREGEPKSQVFVAISSN